MNLGIAFAPLVAEPVLWAAIAAAVILALLLFVSRSRGATIRALALGAGRAGARQSVAHPRGPRSALFGRRGRGRQEPEPEFWRPDAADRSGARRGRRTAGPYSRPRRARRRSRPVRRRDRRHAVVHRARHDARRRADRPRRRRHHDHRRPGPRRAAGCRRARLRRAHSRAHHRHQGRARPPRRVDRRAALRHRRPVADHYV